MMFCNTCFKKYGKLSLNYTSYPLLSGALVNRKQFTRNYPKLKTCIHSIFVKISLTNLKMKKYPDSLTISSYLICCSVDSRITCFLYGVLAILHAIGLSRYNSKYIRNMLSTSDPIV